MKTFSQKLKDFFTMPQTVGSSGNKPAVKSVVIDGQNVMYGSPTDQKVSLLNLLGLLIELNNCKTQFKCFFDANTFFTLLNAGKKTEAYAYRRLCHDFPDIFIEVPGHSRADDFLLDFVNKGDATIISNDQYRDFSDKYRWLTDYNRRASFLVHSGIMQIVNLGIRANIPAKLSDAETILRDQLGRITGKHVPAMLPYQNTRPANKGFNRKFGPATA
jgi:hypothetical protein